MKTFWDILSGNRSTIDTYTTATHTVFKVNSSLARPLPLRDSEGEKLTLTIRDDLSSLNKFVGSVRAGSIDEGLPS
jgi:NMD protein affecting ribosome stability and mRNA decay